MRQCIRHVLFIMYLIIFNTVQTLCMLSNLHTESYKTLKSIPKPKPKPKPKEETNNINCKKLQNTCKFYNEILLNHINNNICVT